MISKIIHYWDKFMSNLERATHHPEFYHFSVDYPQCNTRTDYSIMADSKYNARVKLVSYVNDKRSTDVHLMRVHLSYDGLKSICGHGIFYHPEADVLAKVLMLGKDYLTEIEKVKYDYLKERYLIKEEQLIAA